MGKVEEFVQLPNGLNEDEDDALFQAALDVYSMAVDNAGRKPKMTTLVEEFAEAVLVARGKHDDPLELELKQIASICVNMLWQIKLYGDEAVTNLRTERK